MPQATAIDIPAVRRHNASAQARIDHLAELAAEAIDARLHDLISRRIAAILDPRINEPATGPLSAREAAALAFVDQYVLHVAGMSDAQVQALLPHFSPGEIFALVHAVYTLDGIERTRLVLDGFRSAAGHD